MTPEEFIHAIDIAVHQAAAIGTIEVLKKPPGRRPDPGLVELSQWFHGLGPEGKLAVSRIVNLASDQATYNFLLVLDGVTAIEPAGKKGSLALLHESEAQTVRLNDAEGIPLGSLFKDVSKT
jgi:hypothetical protein